MRLLSSGLAFFLLIIPQPTLLVSPVYRSFDSSDMNWFIQSPKNAGTVLPRLSASFAFHIHTAYGQFWHGHKRTVSDVCFTGMG